MSFFIDTGGTAGEINKPVAVPQYEQPRFKVNESIKNSVAESKSKLISSTTTTKSKKAPQHAQFQRNESIKNSVAESKSRSISSTTTTKSKKAPQHARFQRNESKNSVAECKSRSISSTTTTKSKKAPQYARIQSNESIKDILAEFKSRLISSTTTTKSKKANIFDTFYDDMGWSHMLEENQEQYHQKKNIGDDIITTRRKVDDLLKKSVLTSEFESLKQVPPYKVSEKWLKLERRRDREKTTGAKWYGLPATEMTQEVKHDLQVIQMRSVLNPKRFYKKNDLKVLPKYFQIGKVVDSPLDYYSNRLTKNERKKTLVDELLADAEFNKYNERKYLEIIEQKQSKEWKQLKKQKRKNKKK